MAFRLAAGAAKKSLLSSGSGKSKALGVDSSEPMQFGCPFDNTPECQEALRQPSRPW